MPHAPVDQDIINLFDRYTHGTMPRRQFLMRLAQLAGGTAAATSILPLLEGSGRAAAQVHEDDSRIATGLTSYSGRSGEMTAYLAHPGEARSYPAVVVVHQNRGLTPHIRDVARRLATEGFLAIAPDALSPLGGASGNQDIDRNRMQQLDRADTISDFVRAVNFAKVHDHSNGHVGAVGFCWGGSMVGQLAVNAEALEAGVVYYGSPPTDAEVERITAPLLLHYAGLDERILARVPSFEAALKANHVTYTKYVYEGVNHAFNDDTRPARYSEEAATLAWQRTLAFLHEHLDG